LQRKRSRVQYSHKLFSMRTIKTTKPPKHVSVGLFVIAFAAVATVLLVNSRAATPVASFETEAGTRSGKATLMSDAGASGGQAIKFGTPGGFQANCIVVPSACGYPDATNTGVPAGTVLTNSGSITVTQNGAVVENKNITGGGQIIVRANNVTIKNTKIVGCTYYPIDYDDGQYSGLVVQDTEIGLTCPEGTASIAFGGYTAIRVNAYGGADGFKANSDSVIQDSYIHDLAVSSGSHNDGVQSTGGNNVTLRHNTCDIGSAGVCLQLGSSNSGWLVTDNLIRATGWALSGGDGTSNSQFTNNRFVRMTSWYGPYSIGGSGNTFSGNYYDDNGAAIN
jgi:hypothetical protein